MNDSSNESGLEAIEDDELLKLAWDHYALDLHTAIPARVDSFNAGDATHPPTVKVTLMLNRLVPDGNGDHSSERLPQLDDVLVQYPRTKKFFCVFPLEQGDEGLVLFAETNIASWRATGNQSDPGDVARHTLDGAVFLPGVCSDKNGLGSTLGSNMLLGRDGTDTAQIEITDDQIRLGKGATKAIAREGDPIKIDTPGALATWMNQVEGVCNGVSTGAVNPLSSTFLTTPGVEIKSGDPDHKAGT